MMIDSDVFLYPQCLSDVVPLSLLPVESLDDLLLKSFACHCPFGEALAKTVIKELKEKKGGPRLCILDMLWVTCQYCVNIYCREISVQSGNPEMYSRSKAVKHEKVT